MNHTTVYPSDKFMKSPREAEMDRLHFFLRKEDLQNARRVLLNLLRRGEQVSREIMAAYERLELKP